MLDAMLEGCVPIVRRTHNGRTAWVPLHSAHARADRETLKAALRDALGRVEYLRDESTDGSADRGFAVLNIQGSAPPSNGSKSELFALLNETLLEEPSLHAHVKQRLSERVRLSKTKPLVLPEMNGDPLPPPVSGPQPGALFTQDRHVQLRWPDMPWARGDLLHPPWYLGFIQDTEIRLRIPHLYKATYARGAVLFGPKGPNQPTLEFEVFADNNSMFFPDRPVSGPYYRVNSPVGGEIVIPIARLYEGLDHPVLGFGDPTDNYLGHLIERDPERGTTPLFGWLVVWHTDQWSKQFIVGRTIDGVRGSYVCPDYFRDVTVRLLESDHGSAALFVEGVSIQLNGDNILDSTYGTPTFVGWDSPLDLSPEIEEFHENLMLFDGQIAHAAAPTYDPAAIRNSPVLKSAKNDLFTAWTRRNGMDWDRDGNLWRNQPDGWCTAFVAWHFLWAFPNSGFPVGTEGSKRNWFHEHRDQGCYIYPLAVNPATGLNYRYGELGDLICPGYGVSLRSWGHRNIFLYWLESPRFPGVFTSARDVHTAWSRTHIPTDPNQRLPGQFDSRSAINWFRAIGGNQGGARVTVGHYAIVNIEPEFVEIIRDLRQADGPLRTGAVLWCSSILNETEIGNPDGFGFVNLNQKRPVNQGRFGPWNQLGDILP